jgi:hypothetical protein
MLGLRRRVWVLVLVCLGLGVARSSVFAHDVPVHQKVVLQCDAQGLALLWNVELKGPRVLMLRAAYDKNGDGRFDVKEASRLVRRVLSPFLREFRLGLNGEILRLGLEEGRATLSHGGKKLVLNALTTTLHPFKETADALRRVTLRYRGELNVWVQGQAPWRLKNSSIGEISADGLALVKSIDVPPNEKLTLLMERNNDAPSSNP